MKLKQKIFRKTSKTLKWQSGLHNIFKHVTKEFFKKIKLQVGK